MAIYIFNLLVGYYPSGVDNAQGYRAKMLKYCPHPVWHVFTDLPARRDVALYEEAGIDIKSMLSVHQYFTDNQTLELSGKAEDKLKEMKKSLHYTALDYQEKEIRLLRNGAIIASVLLDKNNKEYFYGIHYINGGAFARTEFYTDGISYVDYYVAANSGKGWYAKVARRAFYNRDGSVAYEQIFGEKEDWYLFPDGRRYNESQFIAEFVKKLSLAQNDIVIVDRSSQFNFIQPLFQYGKKAKFITVFHTGHYFEENESSFYLYLNYEYYYWFKYSKKIDIMIVSTREQKEELIEKLHEYGCEVPDIRVIPAGGIEHLRYPERERRPYSLLTVSCIDKRKKIDWIIKSVIKAHRINPNITIDLYGHDEFDYLEYLQDIVSSNNAQSYVRFMGRQDVRDVYKNYEVYISASVRESLGLSVMEAVGSGNAIIGLDVKYGNRLFVHPGENGYLVDFDLSYVGGNDEKLIDDMADKIVEVFADTEQLKKFHEHSYEIARSFFSEKIETQWRNILD